MLPLQQRFNVDCWHKGWNLWNAASSAVDRGHDNGDDAAQLACACLRRSEGFLKVFKEK